MINMKKISIFLLVFVLLASVMVLPAFAAEETATVESDAAEETATAEEEIADDEETEGEPSELPEITPPKPTFTIGEEVYNFGETLIVGIQSPVQNEITPEDSANRYLENYETNVQEGEDFRTHVKEAIAVVRESIPAFASFWSLVPPIIAIVLALITKEVYSSLFVGILAGGLIYSGFQFEATVTHVFSDGFVASVADSYNVGILIFLVMLGALVAMMNKAGGSAAFGRWAAKHIKSRMGAQIATIVLGCLIFIDDYFNCLTVGSVMRPVTDKHNISRAKLSYLIDATAAPICIIAPISSWAAAVAGFAQGEGPMSGISLFISAIPFNFYAILTIVMMLVLSITKFDYGPMATHERNAIEKGDLFTTAKEQLEAAGNDEKANPKGRVIDLVIPVVFLIIACVVGMIYSGGFFTPDTDGYKNFIVSFSNSDASVGLVYGSFITVIFAVVYFLCRRVLSFKSIMESVPEGFKAMVPAIMILICAWTLKTMTDSLGAKYFISGIVEGGAAGFAAFLPAIIFLIAVGLSFATGTSWGTFGILIPIVLSVYGSVDSNATVVAISACMAGAVCGDHCSPISDTTIMASAGAQCNHLNHVSTQLPYALTVAAVSFVAYIIAGFVPNAFITLPIAIVLMVGTLMGIDFVIAKKNKAKSEK